MRYSKESLRDDLKGLGVSSWDWAGSTPGAVRRDVRARNPALARRSPTDLGSVLERRATKAAPLEELVEYCWTAYEKALGTAGDMIIGRVKDLNAAGLYEKVAGIVGERTLFEGGTQGNLLQMDKWARVMNDSWVLGGVHRKALFRLASPRVIENLWNHDGYFVVTAREVLGLLHFGYAFEQVGPWQCLVCKNQVQSTTADLVKYDHYISQRQTIRQAHELLDRVGSAARASGQVQGFPFR